MDGFTSEYFDHDLYSAPRDVGNLLGSPAQINNALVSKPGQTAKPVIKYLLSPHVICSAKSVFTTLSFLLS